MIHIRSGAEVLGIPVYISSLCRAGLRLKAAVGTDGQSDDQDTVFLKLSHRDLS